MRLGDLSSIYGTSESPTFWTPDVDLFGPIAPPATAALHGPPLGASAFVASAPPPLVGEVTVVERIAVLIVSICIVDLVAILVFLEDLLVIWLLKF
jgi:hypothetical protein